MIVFVTRPGWVGRYLLLVVPERLSRRKLVARATGCLAAHRKRVACPAAEEEEHKSPNTPEEHGVNKPEEETPPPPGPETTYAETVGGVTHTWTDYQNAGGTEGAIIEPQETVRVSCRVIGHEVEDHDPWWYRIASSPWDNGYYASADAFYNNNETSGSLIGTPFVDTRVREC